jgi:GxxExxY protein
MPINRVYFFNFFKNIHAMPIDKSLTDNVIDAFYTVYNKLGFGFTKDIYENALFIELRKRGLTSVSQKRYPVYYRGQEVGEFFADLIVNHTIMLEVKVFETLAEGAEIQLESYLRASDIELGFVLSFGMEPNYIRKIYANKDKDQTKKNQ